MTDWLKRKWCEWMHDAPMQPIRGKWICRVCQVEHPVMWDEPERGKRRAGGERMPVTDLAMQTRCIYCHREQYAPAVWDISHGEHPCVWCGKTPPKMTVGEYQKAMEEYYAR